MTTQEPYEPVVSPSTTTSSTTTTTLACNSTPIGNPMTLNAYKGSSIGIPGFTWYATVVGKPTRLVGFRIKDLPLPADGVLFLNGVAVADEQLISATDNGKLVYTIPANADAQGSFNFLVETTCGNSASVAVTINVTEKPADPECNCPEVEG